MKTMILAAGFGTRLLPYTHHTPKPLFSIGGQPVLDIIIKNLENSGCEAIVVNTHYLHDKIVNFIQNQEYKIPVTTCYENEILGTGGAVKNVSDFWDNQPFMVINSDILTNIDFHDVYKFHLNHDYPATMVLYDDKNFNSVSVSHDCFVNGFNCGCSSDFKQTFTGIQVFDPEILEYIPDNQFYTSIDAFKQMMNKGKQIKAYIPKQYYWKDIGTPETYISASIELMSTKVFAKTHNIEIKQLKGDGSDRKWYRIQAGEKTLIIAEHGITQDIKVRAEVDAFIDIGTHLYNKGIPVPKIHLYDRFSGLVFMEDLGNNHLENLVKQCKNNDKIISFYKSVIDNLVHMAVLGAEKFNLSWTYQTKKYDRELILEKECCYFTNEFLQNYLGISLGFKDFQEEFEFLADKTLEYEITGFIHRDMQSRNIMNKNNRFYFIDFQGGRLGPVQYDLSSLLIDPYVELPYSIQNRLISYYIKKISSYADINPDKFLKGLMFTSITRNLQMLGAFSFLSLKKNKPQFKQYIPTAVKSLKTGLYRAGGLFPKLKQILEKI